MSEIKRPPQDQLVALLMLANDEEELLKKGSYWTFLSELEFFIAWDSIKQLVARGWLIDAEGNGQPKSDAYKITTAGRDLIQQNPQWPSELAGEAKDYLAKKEETAAARRIAAMEKRGEILLADEKGVWRSDIKPWDANFRPKITFRGYRNK
jgi:predicted transcriptional regulator